MEKKIHKDERLKHFPDDLPLAPKTQHFYVLLLGAKAMINTATYANE
jgi:hypothetical protein